MKHIISHYYATNEGEIYSAHSKRILKKTESNVGYFKVSLRIDGKTKCEFVHRLIALAFIDNKDNLPVVNHKDGDKLNNKPSNLEWCTDQTNSDHAWNTGLCTHKGIAHPDSKFTEDQIREIRERAKTEKQVDLAKEFDVCKATMNQIIKRKTYKKVQ